MVSVLSEFIRDEFQNWEDMIVWPRDLSIVFRECDGSGGSGYSSTENEVTICYSQVLELARETLKGEKIDAYFLQEGCLYQEGIDYLKDSTWRARTWNAFQSNLLTEMSFYSSGQVRLGFMNDEGPGFAILRWWVERATRNTYAIHVGLPEGGDSTFSLYTLRDNVTMESDGRVWRRVQHVAMGEELKGSLPTRPCSVR